MEVAALERHLQEVDVMGGSKLPARLPPHTQLPTMSFPRSQHPPTRCRCFLGLMRWPPTAPSSSTSSPLSLATSSSSSAALLESGAVWLVSWIGGVGGEQAQQTEHSWKADLPTAQLPACTPSHTPPSPAGQPSPALTQCGRSGRGAPLAPLLPCACGAQCLPNRGTGRPWKQTPAPGRT